MGLGVDNWQAVTALLSGLVAKEVVVTTLNSLYQVGQVFEPVVWGDFIELLYTLCMRILSFPLRILMIDVGSVEMQSVYQQYFTQVSAFAYMVFILLYFPCVSTLLVLKEEFGSYWALVSFLWSTLLAVTFAKMVYMGPGVIELVVSVILVGGIYKVRVKNDAITS
jgi:ferrous iron transport protein B